SRSESRGAAGPRWAGRPGSADSGPWRRPEGARPAPTSPCTGARRSAREDRRAGRRCAPGDDCGTPGRRGRWSAPCRGDPPSSGRASWPERARRRFAERAPRAEALRPARRRWLMLVTALAALAIAALVTLGGPPAAEAQRKKIVNIAAKEPDTLDPHSSTLGQSQAISRFMFRGLTRFAIKDGKVTTAEVEPDLAESWTLSPEGTIWTFKLRKGVQFHKGFGELTAEDVKFSFERQIKKAPGTRYGVNLDVIKSIEVVNPYTVQIALTAFDPIFLLRMVGYQQGYILSKKAVEKYGEQFK